MDSVVIAPGPWRVFGNMVKSIYHGRWHTVARVYNPNFTAKANECHAKLVALSPEIMDALRDLREASTEAYKQGRVTAEPFVRAGNLLASLAS